MVFAYAARSDANLEEVCERLEVAYGFMPFLFDAEDNWQYATTGFDKIRYIGVTKADNYGTIQKWLPGCPRGVNYEVRVKADAEPPDLLSRLTDILGAQVVKFYETANEW